MADQSTRAPGSDDKPAPDPGGFHDPDDQPVELPDREALSIISPDGGARGPDFLPLPNPNAGETVPDPDFDT
jgi:hypothetical protein